MSFFNTRDICFMHHVYSVTVHTEGGLLLLCVFFFFNYKRNCVNKRAVLIHSFSVGKEMVDSIFEIIVLCNDNGLDIESF